MGESGGNSDDPINWQRRCEENQEMVRASRNRRAVQELSQTERFGVGRGETGGISSSTVVEALAIVQETLADRRGARHEAGN